MSRPKMTSEAQNLAQYMTFFGMDGTSMTSPDPSALITSPHPMAGLASTELECAYDPHLFGVDLPVKYHDAREDEADGSADNNGTFDFYAHAPWNHWPVVGGGSMDEASSTEPSVYHPASHFGPMPTEPGMTNFEPMMATVDSLVFSTQATPTSPSPSSSTPTTYTTTSPYSDSVAAFSRKSSFQHMVHSPASSIIHPPAAAAATTTTTSQQLEFRFEPVSPGAWRSSPKTSRQVTGRPQPGSEDKSLRAAGMSTATATAATTMGKARGDGSPEYATASPTAADYNSSSSGSAAGPSARRAAARGAEPGTRATGTTTTRRKTATATTTTTPDEQSSKAGMSQRQRNRAAANKCRKKSKVATMQLEAADRVLSEQHSELSATVTGLRDEVLALKNEILLHGNCDCDIIQDYLSHAARNLKGTMTMASYHQHHQQQAHHYHSVGGESSSAAASPAALRRDSLP